MRFTVYAYGHYNCVSDAAPFAKGEDRLACPVCGTHSPLDRRRCWNCGTDLGPADRIRYEPGQADARWPLPEDLSEN